MSRALRLVSVALLFLATAGDGRSAQPPAAAQPSSHLFTLVGDFPLGAATDRTDYENVDSAAHRLYIAKMGDGKLLVFDIGRNKLVRELDGFPKITGVLAVPQLHRVFASVPGSGVLSAAMAGLGMLGLGSGGGQIAVLDSTSLKEIARLDGGVFPDGIAYDPADRRIFVSDEFGSAVRAVDAMSNNVLARIDLRGEAGNVQYNSATARIYVAIQSRNELGVIDPLTLALVGRIRLDGCNHPHGLAIAPAGGIGYVACDGNDVLLSVDLAAAKVLGALAVANDPDVLAIDAGAGRLYVAGESGNLSIFDISQARAPLSVGEVFVGPGAHALAVDPETHRLYFALADLGGKSVLRVLAPNP